MFLKLDFETIFSSTGRRITGVHEFGAGLTGVFGDNEAGKSLRFEMLRFALFGTKALRASLPNYKKLKSEVTFVVDETYRVYRDLHKTELFKGDEKIASGASVVNEQIEKILGYGMGVFDIANASLQDEVQALTNMAPTERKKMVDRVVGLDTLDKLDKLYASDASELKAELDALRGMKRELVEPIMPEGYRPSSELRAEIEKLKPLVEERRNIAAKIAALPKQEPPAPEAPNAGRLPELYELKAKQDTQVAEAESIRRRIIELEAVKKPLNPYSVEALKEYLSGDQPEVWERFRAYQREKEAYLPPKHDETQLRAILATFERKQAWERAEALRCNSTVDCPHCQKSFSLQQGEIDKLLEPVRSVEEVETLGYTVSSVKAELAVAERYQLFTSRWPDVVAPTAPDMGLRGHVENLLFGEEKYQSARAELDTLAVPMVDTTDYASLIKKAQAEKAALDLYELQIIEYKKALNYKQSVSPRLLELGNVDTDLSARESLIVGYTAYEQQQATYLALKGEQEKLQATIAEKETSLTTITMIRKMLSELRPKVKSYLMPSLNSVSSNLLAQMTNSVRNSIYINEDFDILVDGQRVETLSGSGKAVVNLAIRIALGSVLTHKVFSVFMADEVDAAMRGERAAYTAQCFKNLTKVVKQILVISHKDLEVDTRILL